MAGNTGKIFDTYRVINVDEVINKFNKFRLKKSIQLNKAMIDVFRLVGITATSKFMVFARVVDASSGFTVGKKGSRLNIRTSRLSRSLLNIPSFAGGAGGDRENVSKIFTSGTDIIGLFGTNVPYAKIHEQGGTTHPNVTKRSRGFFWAMYIKTGLPMWKGMALTKKQKFDITLPARPFLNPALKFATPQAVALFAKYLRSAERGF